MGLLDSGASKTVVNEKGLALLRNLQLKLLPSLTSECRVANGGSCPVLGSIHVPFKLRDRVCVIDVLVVPSVSHTLILGTDFWRCMGVVPDLRHGEWTFTDTPETELFSLSDTTHLTPEQSQRLKGVVAQIFGSMPESLGCTSIVSHKIKTTADPIKQRCYPISPAVQKHVDAELDRMLRDGVIEPSSSPWASPIVLVRKKDNSYRFCVDYRKLNKVTERDAYPLPFVSHTLDKLRDARFLSSLDIKSAYWQIPVDEASKPLTAFTVPRRGLFQFCRMPFGLHNAAATWQRLIDRVLSDLEPYVFVYLDDIIVVTQDFEKHLEMLRLVFKRLVDAGLTVSREKCKFCCEELRYLGYVVDRSGLRVDPEKVTAILNLPPPRNVTEVRRILGMASWYRRFIPNFATLVSALSNLLRKNVRFEWNPQCAEAFSKLKDCLSSAPVMTCPDFDIPFCIQTDASNFGLGAVLTQNHKDGERVISYISRSLNKNERKFTTTEKECLAVVWAIEKFRPYVEGTHFSVITDHFSLKWLHNLRDPSGRLARWSVKLQQYSFDITHRGGKENVVPDALSRSVPTIDIVSLAEEGLGEIKDQWYARLCRNVESHPLKFSDWRVESGRLFKQCRNQYPVLAGSEFRWNLVVPKNQRKSTIELNHDVATAGHLGVHKTFARLGQKYYWPKMKADVAKYIRSCLVCSAQKPEQKAPAGLLSGRPNVSRPWELICVDIVGPLPRSTKGNCFIFSVMDYFSKFTLFFPLRQASTSRITKILENNVFLLFGVPRVIVCDNGQQFTSREFKKIAQDYGCRLAYTAFYHAQANAVERVHRVLKTMLASYVKDNHRTWEDHLQRVACALRTSVHESTGQTPFFVNFGREINLSGESTPQPSGCPGDQPKVVPTADSRREQFEGIYHDVRRRLDKAYEKSKRVYNLRHRDVQYVVGEKVWRRNYPQSDAAKYFTAKLAQKFVGPFLVKKKLSPWTYKLVDLHDTDAGIWNAKDLKPFHDRAYFPDHDTPPV